MTRQNQITDQQERLQHVRNIKKNANSCKIWVIRFVEKQLPCFQDALNLLGIVKSALSPESGLLSPDNSSVSLSPERAKGLCL